MTRRILYDLATFQNGRAFKRAETKAKYGMPIVKIAEMNKGITPQTGRYDGAVDDKHLIARGDLLFAWSGTIVIQRWQGPDAVLNQHIFKVTAAPDVDQRYLEFVLHSLMSTFDTLVLDQKTTMGHVKVADLKRIEVDLPPLGEQRGIAETLGAIDDKIESNRRLVTWIPDLIRATVDACADDEAEVLPVVELAEFVNGGAYTKGASGTGRMVIRIKDLNSGPGGSTVYNDLSVPDNKIARPGDLLMSWSGSLGVYRWSRDEAIINQHIFKVLPKDFPAWLVFDRLEAVIEIFQAIAKDKATTMGHIQRGHLVSTTIEVPTTSAIVRLDEQLGPVWERLLLAEREIHRLESLREALLPELLSGRIRVPEAEVAA